MTAKPSYGLAEQGATDVIGHILSGGCEFDFNAPYAMLATHCGYCDGELQNMSTFFRHPRQRTRSALLAEDQGMGQGKRH